MTFVWAFFVFLLLINSTAAGDTRIRVRGLSSVLLAGAFATVVLPVVSNFIYSYAHARHNGAVALHNVVKVRRREEENTGHT
jgi:hypothetical protein